MNNNNIEDIKIITIDDVKKIIHIFYTYYM
jgi:hypothetical protein